MDACKIIKCWQNIGKKADVLGAVFKKTIFGPLCILLKKKKTISS